ncbi:MAG: hypothetical protein MR051_00820 [Lentisphaeria bacterium]|nr:hypothetical protein [Lentisphaeria bacterium]
MKPSVFTAVLGVMLAGIISVQAAQFEEIRIDLRSVRDAKIGSVTVSQGLYIAVQTPRGVQTGLTSALVYSERLTAEWKKFTISFVPEQSGWIAMAIHTPGTKDVETIKPVWVDDIQVTGGKIQNGDFEIVKDGKPVLWNLGKDAKLITGKAMDGEHCVQVFHGSGIASQHIKVTANEKVTLSFMARLAE